MTTDSNSVLAEIILEKDVSYKQKAGYSYIVEWVMTFKNDTSTANDSAD
jgi:hypothetical protein